MRSRGDVNNKDNKDNEDTRSDTMPRWLAAVAIFGDSTVALGFSFLLLVVSIGIAFYLEDKPKESFANRSIDNLNAEQVEEEYRKLGPIPTWIQTSVPVLEWRNQDPQFLQELKQSFDRDGVVAVRGLLEPELLDLLDKASSELIQQQYEKKLAKPKGPLTGRPQQNSETQFYAVKEGVIFMGLNSSSEEQSETNQNPDTAFLQVALQSKIPQLIAETLLQLSPGETLRMIRDIFLAKDTDEYVCGWHVDDTGFWPATAEAPEFAFASLPVGSFCS